MIIIIIIIIMKTFNSRGSHGHLGSKCAFTHTLYINTVTTTLCEAPAQLVHNLESNFI